MTVEFIAMRKGDEMLEVNPDCVAAHEAVGWCIVPVQREPDAFVPLQDGRTIPVSTSGVVAAKGPKGLWYAMNGDERISKGFKTEAEAIASVSEG